MTNAVMANGNIVTQQSNLADEGDAFVSGRDVTAEKAAKGHFNRGTAWVSPEDMNNNPDFVVRDGMSQRAGGEYKPDDVLTFDGMEVTHEVAVQLGLIRADGSTGSSPQEDFARDFENNPSEPRPQDTRPEEFQLLDMQMQVALKGDPSEVLETMGLEVAANGGLSPEGLNYAQNNLGMSPEVVQNTINELTDVGGRVIHGFLEVGDDLGGERVEMLTDLAENGTTKQQQTVRKLWVDAATGKLTQEQAIKTFDRIAQEYEQSS